MPAQDLLTPVVRVAARPRPGRKVSQDRHLVLPHAVVVLDGATDPAEPAGRDGGWYAERLGTALATTLTPGRPPAEAVHDAIGAVTTAHGLVAGSSPSSTVAIAAWDGDTVHGYVLGDSVIAVRTETGAVDILTDQRLTRVGKAVRDRMRDRLVAGAGYDRLHEALVHDLITIERSHRNRPGGYPIAEAVPSVAHQGHHRTWRHVQVAALLTDGASSAVDRYGMYSSWAAALEQLDRTGPDNFVDAVELADLADPHGQRFPRSKVGDDKTAVVMDFRLSAKERLIR